jgi:pimeloyl-ACP methyl ester carboxylesterase
MVVADSPDGVNARAGHDEPGHRGCRRRRLPSARAPREDGRVKVFLVHGMGRTTTSLALLRWRLRAAGHTTHSFGYLVSRTTLPAIVDRFVDHVARHAVDERFAVVGHSLGNVITRVALPRLPRLARFVMLAPPNQPPTLARLLAGNPLFRWLTTDAGQRLADVDGFYATLPVPTMPTLVIAGTSGPRHAKSPWRGAANDGVVAVDETRLPAAPLLRHVEVDALHTFLMNRADVARLALDFLADDATT